MLKRLKDNVTEYATFRSEDSKIPTIEMKHRELMNGHVGLLIWFTGLSGAGKTTLANELEKQLHEQGKKTVVLDGDDVRSGLCKDLGYTHSDRTENIRRVAEVAKLMMDAGLIVIAAFISPLRKDREMVKSLIGEKFFMEVFVDTPLDVCEKRDPKGLYKAAREGKIPNMTGVNSPYEVPLAPDCVLTGNNMKPKVAVALLLDLLCQ